MIRKNDLRFGDMNVLLICTINPQNLPDILRLPVAEVKDRSECGRAESPEGPRES